MAALSKKLRSVEGNGIGFWCPGCEEMHVVTMPPWTWNGDADKPTIRNSVLVTSGHYVPGHKGPECWCTYNAKHPDGPTPFECSRCHSYVTDGCIEFLGDCTHKLVGQTVPLPDCDSSTE